MLPDSESLGRGSILIDGGMYLIFICLILFCLLNTLRMVGGAPQTTYRTKKIFLASSLFLGLLSLSLLQSWKNPYEVPLFLSVLFLCFALCFFNRADWPNTVVRGFFFSVVVFSMVSMGTLLYGYFWLTNQFWNTNKTSTKSLGLTVSAFNREIISQNVEQLKDLCNLNASPELKHLIIDDSTYSYFWNTREPYHALYLTGFWSPSGTYLKDALNSVKSPGFIGGCHWLSADLKAQAFFRGTLCCLRRGTSVSSDVPPNG